MNKNIIINSAPCANAKDVAEYIEHEFGLFQINFSDEFQLETGLSEKDAISKFGYDKYASMRSEVINSLSENLLKPSVIVLVANSVCLDELSQLGYVFALDMSDRPVTEIAEYIFDAAAESFCDAEIEELLVA